MSERGFDDIRTSGAFRPLGGAEAETPVGDGPTARGLAERGVAESGRTLAVESTPSPFGAAPAPIPMTEIEQTRADLSETIDAIQERLAPASGGAATDLVAEATERSAAMARDVVEQAIQEATKQAKVAIVEIAAQAQTSAQGAARELAEQAKASLREATIGRAERMANSTGEAAKGLRANVVTTVKQNPGPAALAALGIGWLVASGRSAKSGGAQTNEQSGTSPSPSPSTAAEYQSEYGSSYASTPDRPAPYTASDATRTAEPTGPSAADAIGDQFDRVQETTGKIVGQTTDAAGKAVGTTVSAAGSAVGGVKSAATGLVGGVQHQAQRIRTMATESPIRTGAATVAVGGLLGLALPVSRRETELIGTTRDSLVDRIEGTAQTTLDKFQKVAMEAEMAGQKEAKYQGLIPGQG